MILTGSTLANAMVSVIAKLFSKVMSTIISDSSLWKSAWASWFWWLPVHTATFGCPTYAWSRWTSSHSSFSFWIRFISSRRKNFMGTQKPYFKIGAFLGSLFDSFFNFFSWLQLQSNSSYRLLYRQWLIFLLCFIFYDVLNKTMKPYFVKTVHF